MKNDARNIQKSHKWKKRIASCITSFVMLATAMPIAPLQEPLNSFWESLELPVLADETEYIPPWYTGGTYNINSAQRLVDYSRAYNSAQEKHKGDTIWLSFSSGGENQKAEGFISIGDTVPFEGKILINKINHSYLNLDKALFAKISDKAQIVYEGDETTAAILTIRRISAAAEGTDPEPLFAKTVTSSGEPNTYGWKINIKPFATTTGNVNCEVGGIIGEIESGASVKLTVTDEQNNAVSRSANAGYICGKLIGSAILTIDGLTASGITVTSSSGNAGGIVGEMESGSTLVLPYMATSPITTVTANGTDEGKGYAGGIVGRNVGGTIRTTAGTNAQYFVITQTISGKKSEGGIAGYYEPVYATNPTDNTLVPQEFALDRFSINCHFNSQGSGTSAGGAFGVLNNKGTLTITDNTDVSDHIITSTHDDGSIANYGGLVGYYQSDSNARTLTIGKYENLAFSGTVKTNTAQGDGKNVTNYGGAIGSIDGNKYVRLNGFTTESTQVNKDGQFYGGAVGSADAGFVDVNKLKVTASGFQGGGVVGNLENGVLRMSGEIDLEGASASVGTDTTKTGQIVGYRDCGFAFLEAGYTLKRSTTAVEVDDVGSWGEIVRFQSSGFTNASVLNGFTDGDHTVTLLSAVTSMSTAAEFARTALNIQHNTGTITGTDAVLKFDSGSSSGTLLGTDLELKAAENNGAAYSISLSNTGIMGLTRDADIRDDHAAITYIGEFDGNGNTLSLQIGTAYGNSKSNGDKGSGIIYRHPYVGLFAKTGAGFTVSNVTIAGDIYTCSKVEQSVGGVAGESVGNFTAEKLAVTANLHHEGASQLYMGGMVGNSSGGSLTIGGTTDKKCEFASTITGVNSHASSCIGGMVGIVSNQTAFTSNIGYVDVSGTVSCGPSSTSGSSTAGSKKNQQIGGLIAYIEKESSETADHSRILNLDHVDVKNLNMWGLASNSMGGLLGYAWCDTTVTMTGVTATGTNSLNVIGSSSVDVAGLVYVGTGCWTVNSLTINDIHVNSYQRNTENSTTTTDAATNVGSFGMIINRGWANSSALYLVISDMDSYLIQTAGASPEQLTIADNFTGLDANAVFDEIIAYSAKYSTTDEGDRIPNVTTNGQAIVSIRTKGNTGSTTRINNLMYDSTAGTYTKPNTYQNQVNDEIENEGVSTSSTRYYGNPNTRYYYDLDLLLAKQKAGTSLTGGEKLLLWSLKQYAHTSLTKSTSDPFYTNPFSSGISGTIDLTGLSYYPVNTNGVTFSDTCAITLDNKDVETNEISTLTPDGYARTTLKTDDTWTQHYLMQNGIFLNVTGAVNINKELSLNGNVAADADGSGALVRGTVVGANGNSTASVTVNETNGMIKLNGIAVHNLGGYSGYAPLLINKTGQYSTLKMRNVLTTVDYKPSGSAVTVPVATSLIGHAGSPDAMSVKLDFRKIQLDGRKDGGITASDPTDVDAVTEATAANQALTTKYHTTRSIFSKATLLESYSRFSGDGTYYYTYEDDWGQNGQNGARYVTYGAEISDSSSQYAGKETHYEGETIGDPPRGWYTNPLDSSTHSAYDRFDEEFLPYVSAGYSEQNGNVQIRVNHGTTVFSGCGTYNDPYIISKGEDLESIARVINGGIVTNFFVYYPADEHWCATENGTRTHTKYIQQSNGSFNDGTNTISQEDMCEWLAGAYYKIESPADSIGANETGIKLSSAFPGISNFDTSATNAAVFHGVIIGSSAKIVNESINPLIAASYGAVIKDVDICVKNSGISLSAKSNTAEFVETNDGSPAYGAVISKVLGGDNIIDNVTVSFDSTTKINLTQHNDATVDYSQLIPVGGYVGVVERGAVIFRGMDTYRTSAEQRAAIAGLSDTVMQHSSTAESMVGSDKWLYVNPIIGRVINGYAFTESTAYRPFENGTRTNADISVTHWVNGAPKATLGEGEENDAVTMQNGTKNYSIPDLKNNYADTAKLKVTSAGNGITFPNAQSIFVLSSLIQSGVTAGTGAAYSDSVIASYGSKRTTHLAKYSGVATLAVAYADATAAVKSDYDISLNDSSTNESLIPYLVKNYVAENSNVYSLTGDSTAYNIELSGTDTDWYLPDGFRGIGSIAYKKNTAGDVQKLTLLLNKMSGLNEDNVVVNMNLNMLHRHYESGFENYLPSSTGQAGFGFFNSLEQNTGTITETDTYKIKYVKISGNINYDVFMHNQADGTLLTVSGSNIKSGYTKAIVDVASYLHVGGLAGYTGFGLAENLRVEDIDLTGLNVDGFKTAGGLFGKMNMQDATTYTAKISRIAIDGALTVQSKQYAGGMIGYVEQTNLSVSDVAITEPKISIYFGACANTSGQHQNGVGGIIGFIKNGAAATSSNCLAVFENITIGNKTTDNDARIGYAPNMEFVGFNDKKTAANYTKSEEWINAGGIIGRTCSSHGGSSDTVSTIDIEYCSVFNVDMYGHRVAGVIGYDNADVMYGDGGSKGSYIRMKNVTVKGTLGSSIMYGITVISNQRGCGGLLGFTRTYRGMEFVNCTVEGYHFYSANDAAGFCANLGSNNQKFLIQNAKIKDLRFHADYAGGLTGWQEIPVYGYNIQADNIQFTNYTDSGSPTTLGYLFGKKAKTIRVVGFSRNNPTPDKTSKNINYVIPKKICGNGDYEYDTNGYIIFADYLNTSQSTTYDRKNDWFKTLFPASDTTKAVPIVIQNENGEYEFGGWKAFENLDRYNTFSPVKRTNINNVEITMQGSYQVAKTTPSGETYDLVRDNQGKPLYETKYYPLAENTPYVTSSPTRDIGVLSETEDGLHMQFLTGDGAYSRNYAASPVKKAIEDIQKSSQPSNFYNYAEQFAVQNYPTVSGKKKLQELDELLESKYSTFKTVMDRDYPQGLSDKNIDFPVLILDETDTDKLTKMLNSYLQLLTNAKIDFAAGRVVKGNSGTVSFGTNYSNCQSPSDSLKVFDVKLAKCVYDSNTNSSTYNSFIPDYTQCCLKRDKTNGKFYIDVDDVDSGHVQFSLIDVEFYNPAVTTEIAYHLYVPVFVKKMLKYNFEISAKSGTNYRMALYDADRGNSMMENLGNPVTLEMRYTYKRDLNEWKEIITKGESILYTYPKTLEIEGAQEDGFNANTRMVLLDVNNGNKAYYSSLNGGQVYGTGADAANQTSFVTNQTVADGGVTKLYLNNFKRKDGTTETSFVSKDFNDYFVITASKTTTAAEAKFYETTANAATVRASCNGNVVYLRPRDTSSGSTDSDQTKWYKIDSINYATDTPVDANGYITEDYYLSIYTEKESNKISHFAFTAPMDFGDSSYPSRYDVSDAQYAHVYLGDLFVITNASLSTSSTTNNVVDLATVITVTMENTVNITGSARDLVGSILSSTTGYHGFLLSMTKQSDSTQKGIISRPVVKVEEYTVGSNNVKPQYWVVKNGESKPVQPTITSNYIQFDSKENINPLLASNNNGIVIKAKVELSYKSNDDITNQFPERGANSGNNIGTWIGCTSCISSLQEAIASSKLTEDIDELTGKNLNADPPPQTTLYYTEISSKAKLYVVSDDRELSNVYKFKYDQLGINALNLTGPTTDTIYTHANYDISEIGGEDADGVILTVQLRRKAASGRYPESETEALTLGDYLADFKFNGAAPTSSTNIQYTYVMTKTAAVAAGIYEGNVYSIPITFKVKNTEHYANYKLIVTATLYNTVTVTGSTDTTDKPVSGSGAVGHLIYTYAKVVENGFENN